MERTKGFIIAESYCILKEKALEIARGLGNDTFKASNGFLDKWLFRNDIKMKKIHGETHIYNFDSVVEWRNSILPSILGKFSLNDIFNCDETGLFFKKLPLRTYEKKKASPLGTKIINERISILLCANASGTEKLTPLVIGKYLKPRCFR